MYTEAPQTTNLRHLHWQAKTLLKQCKSGDTQALDFVREHLSYFADQPNSKLVSDVRLHHAQLAIARHYGCVQWNGLLTLVKAMTIADLAALTPVQSTRSASRHWPLPRRKSHPLSPADPETAPAVPANPE